jgi:hypothetical protein
LATRLGRPVRLTTVILRGLGLIAKPWAVGPYYYSVLRSFLTVTDLGCMGSILVRLRTVREVWWTGNMHITPACKVSHTEPQYDLIRYNSRGQRDRHDKFSWLLFMKTAHRASEVGIRSQSDLARKAHNRVSRRDAKDMHILTKPSMLVLEHCGSERTGSDQRTHLNSSF